MGLKVPTSGIAIQIMAILTFTSISG